MVRSPLRRATPHLRRPARVLRLCHPLQSRLRAVCYVYVTLRLTVSHPSAAPAGAARLFWRAHLQAPRQGRVLPRLLVRSARPGWSGEKTALPSRTDEFLGGVSLVARTLDPATICGKQREASTPHRFLGWRLLPLLAVVRAFCRGSTARRRCSHM
eukprot:1160915-Prorocentrum_minimum.AAC.1